jgi:hypothetical protein
VVLNLNDTKDRYEFRRDIPKDVSSIYSTHKYRRRLFLLRGISLSFGKEIEGTISMDSNKLCKAFGLDFGTLKSFIDALVKSELLLEVKSYSEKFAVSPSLRVSGLKGIIPLYRKDCIALTFLQEFKENV